MPLKLASILTQKLQSTVFSKKPLFYFFISDILLKKENVSSPTNKTL